ncbi:Costars domain-containing protein [Mycena indigotica]|uniref:Costars domain-containing protein n=1 Tax=Mycena indigotica TaxID=2126181 RepID=A0A8H6SML0_9AGAR|nr:Costars domain-containing protein [Mycena indigotica]KAF7301002.1 Costars domain-containing protein [Mycena indigotica]
MPENLSPNLRRELSNYFSLHLKPVVLCGIQGRRSNLTSSAHFYRNRPGLKLSHITSISSYCGYVPAHTLPTCLIPTLQLVVSRATSSSKVNHLDIHLCDTNLALSEEQLVTDSLITYVNHEALLEVVCNCDLALVWARVTSRLGRRDHPDEVLTAIWGLCRLFLDPQFKQSDVIPLPTKPAAFPVPRPSMLRQRNHFLKSNS